MAVFCQVDPDRFHADEKTYFRYTRWRSTRAVAQILANLGASFPADSRIFHPLDTTVLNLDGAWQMKVTLQLPPAASDATAHADPGITPAAQKLVAEDRARRRMDAVTLPADASVLQGSTTARRCSARMIDVPQSAAGKDLVLALGVLDDFDNTYFNGVEVGHTDQDDGELVAGAAPLHGAWKAGEGRQERHRRAALRSLQRGRLRGQRRPAGPEGTVRAPSPRGGA